MPNVPRPFPPALPHGAIEEVLPGIFQVTGTVRVPGPPLRFSRNMTIVKEGERLVLVNTVRLDEAGLSKLDALGKVTDVVRIAGNHGSDDPFYADRYGAKVWAVNGMRYTAGFDAKAETTYFDGHVEIEDASALPLAGAKLHVMHSSPPEALLILEREGGVCIAGDCLQNWNAPDDYFNLFARVMMRVLGFIKPYNVGPAWLKQCKPPKDELAAVTKLAFEHVLPAHGKPVIGGARAKFAPVLERVSR
jgi:hypothetical protein